MEKLAELKQLYEECGAALSRNQAAVLNQGKPDSPRGLYTALSRLVEQTFSGYHIDFFLTRDYFRLFCEVHRLLVPFDPEVSIKLFELTQLVVSNTRNAEDLSNICALEGFGLFFGLDFAFERHDECVDYFVNIAKSLVLKLDSNSRAEGVEQVVGLALGLARHRDNLVRTTVRNIALALSRLDNPAVRAMLARRPFRFFLLDLIREVKERVFSLDKSILEERVKEIQDTIYFVQESFHYLDELIVCSTMPEMRAFIANLLFVGVFAQILLPAFRGDLKVSGGRFIGINTVLFTFDAVFAGFQTPLVLERLVFDIFLDDGLRLDRPELLDMGLFFGAPGDVVLAEGGLLEGLEHASLFAGPLRFGGRFNPQAREKFEGVEVPLSQIKGRVFHTLLAFFKSKDDNMILLTSNLFLHLFGLARVVFDQSMAATGEKLADLLRMDPSLRLATYENLCRLFCYLARNSAPRSPELAAKVFGLLEQKIKNLRRLLESEKFGELLIARMRKCAVENDSPALLDAPRPAALTWLALYNYNYSAMPSKDLRYIGLPFKVELNEDELVEVEIRQFVLLKNLRYRVHEESVLMDFEKSIPHLYQQSYASIDNPNFVEGACLVLNFEQDRHIIRLFSGEGAEMPGNPKLYLASFGRDLMLLEEADRGQRMYRILFREDYANIIFYTHRSNPRQLNLTLKSRVKFWGVLFPTAQVCLQAKNLLDDIFKDFTGKERQFIGAFLKTYEADNVA